MNKPHISIVVPVYNVENYLPQCLNSILSQSYKNYELIVVDDGSTDRSSEICDEFGKRDNRIKVLHKKNGGVGSARNYGLSMVSGEWLIFIDSDDYLLDGALDIMVNFSYKRDSDYFLFGICTEEYVLSDAKKIGVQQANPRWLIGRMLEYCISSGPFARVFKTSIAKSIMFNEKLKIGEDLLYNIQYLLQCNSCQIIDKYVYFYRSNPNSVMHSRHLTSEYIALNDEVNNFFSNTRKNDFENELATFNVINLTQSIIYSRMFPSFQMKCTIRDYIRKFPSTIIHHDRYVKFLMKSFMLADIYLAYRFAKMKFKELML